VLQRGLRTPDLAGGAAPSALAARVPAEVEVGTDEITDAVLNELRA
jgi:hypothetical protein